MTATTLEQPAAAREDMNEQFQASILINDVRAERADYLHQKVVSFVGNQSRIASNDELTGLIAGPMGGQVGVNLGAPSERLMVQPFMSRGLLTVEPTSNASGFLVGPKEGVGIKELDEATEQDEKFQRYKAAAAELLEAIKVPNTTSAYTSESFSINDKSGQPKDRDFLLAMMQEGYNLPLFHSPEDAAIQVDRAKAKIAELPIFAEADNASVMPQEGIYLDKNGAVSKILKQSSELGIYIALKAEDPAPTADFENQRWKFGYEVNPGEINLEVGKGGAQSAEPFIDSQTGQELLLAFEASGLQLAEGTRKIFAEAISGKRYGQAYSELTREVAKVVDRDTNSITSLFEGDKQAVLEAIQAIEPGATDHFSSMVVIDLIKQLAARELVGDAPRGSDLPVTAADIHIKDGACKDAENYYSAGKTFVKEVEGKRFISKSEGVPTLINTEPVVFNGITLQPGALFGKQTDGGYAMLRLTEFALGDEAADAFGVQYKQSTTDSLEASRHYHHVQQLVLGQ